MVMISVSLVGGSGQKEIKYAVIGFPKCGQVSMQEYLAKRYNDVYRIDRPELIWRRSGVKDFEEQYHNYGVKGIIITRNPVKACWSYYWYIHYGTEGTRYMEYEDFLTQKIYSDPLGEKNPISCYNFEKWIKRFQKFNPIVVRLEDMIENKNFPLLNTTIGNRPDVKTRFDGKMPEMTEEQRTLTEKLLKKEIQDHPDPYWSVDYM